MVRCDRCPQPAKYETFTANGPLFFCYHHSNEYSQVLVLTPILIPEKMFNK